MEDEKKPGGVELTIAGKRRKVVGPVTITIGQAEGFEIDPELVDLLRSAPLAYRTQLTASELCGMFREAGMAERLVPELDVWEDCQSARNAPTSASRRSSAAARRLRRS